MDALARCGLTRRQLAELLKRTRSPYIGERAAAERDFRALGPNGIEALTEFAAAKARVWQRRRRAYFGLVAGYVLVMLPAIVYCAIAIKEAQGDPGRIGELLGGVIGGFGGGLGGGLLGGFAWLLVPPPELLWAANLLAQVDDLRGIGPLIRALNMRFADNELRHGAGKALARLLPRLAESSAQLMSPEDREGLGRYLMRSQPDREEELVLAMVAALAHCGDSATLRVLEAFQKRISEKQLVVELATGKRQGQRALGLLVWRRDPLTAGPATSEAALRATVSVKEATQIAIGRLTAKLERTASGEMLLRAAENGAEDSLLRPARGESNEEPDQLLRASTAE